MNMNTEPKNCIVQIYKEVFIHTKIIRHSRPYLRQYLPLPPNIRDFPV